MANNPTIVAASLKDEDLISAIDKLVKHVDDATKKMAGSMDSAVEQMKKKLGELGNVKIDFGGTSSGVSGTKRVENEQKSLETQIRQTTQAAKEQKTTFDQTAQSQQVAIRSASGSFRNADTMQMMQTNLDLLKEKLRDARQQYSSFVALAAQATTTGDKGLYQFATSGVHQYEQEVKTLIPQIRTLQGAIQQMGDVIAPQGHTIQNYVNSIGKASPELKQLGEQIKSNSMAIERGNSDMNSATSSANRYTEAIIKQDQAIRESEAYKKGERVVISTLNDGTEVVAFSEKRLSLEQQIINAKQAENQIIQQQAAAEQQVEENVRLTEEELKKVYAEQKRVNEEINKRANGGRGGISPFQSYDDLRQSIAQVLGLQEGQVRIANTQTSSYEQLSRSLTHLKQAYDRLSESDRKSDQGKALLVNMHEIERSMSRIRSQASRPINLTEALGLKENTLDDIAYKMQMLASYRSGLDVNAKRGEIKEVNAEYERLKKKMDEVMNKNQQMIASNNALGRSWNYMKNRLAFYFTVGASTQFVKNLIEVRSQYEMNERALGILINSAERGTQIFNELSQMALVSPYTLIELSAAAKQLTAYDVAAKDVVDTTRRLADMASAVGVPIERLTYALGQIKAYGYLNSRDARMFANAGIPLVRELSKYYTELEGKMVSVGDVYDRMKKKAIDYNDVMSVVTKMTDEGGKFFDFQAKMADTLKVRLANLTLAWNNMLNDMGKETQGVLTTGIGALRTLFQHWKDIDNAIKQFAGAFVFYKLYQAILIANVGLAAFGKQMAWNILLGRRLSSVVFALARSFKALITSPATWWTLVGVAAASASMAIWNMNEAQEALNKSLRDGAKGSYEETERFLKQYNKIRESLYKTEKDSAGKEITTPVNIEKGEAKKTWEAIREQIELSSESSEVYIGKLMQIENLSERVRQGFNLIDVIQSVSAALKELGDNTIKVSTDWSDWWNANLLPDGWKDNLSDYQEALDNVRNTWGDVDKAVEKWSRNKFKDAELNEDIVEMNSQLVQLRNNLNVTMSSILDFLRLKGWDKDEARINEVFKQIGSKMVQEGQLDPQKAFLFQMEWERGRSQAAKQALEARIQDEKAALEAAQTDISRMEVQSRLDALNTELADFDKNNGRGKVLWEDYTKWMKEQHLSEMREMFRGMSAEDIKNINFGEERWANFVKRTTTQYAKEHRTSINDVFTLLRNWVLNANKWSIFIPLTISTEDDKTVTKSLEEADAAADKAWKDMQRLDKEIARLRKKGARNVGEEGMVSDATDDDKRYTKALEEKAAAQKDYNKAVSEGGQSKKENAAGAKAQKAAETELQKAIKEELKLIDEATSMYKKMTDSGINRTTALTYITNKFGDSIEHINSVLRKNNIPKFDIRKFAGTDDPHKLLQMLEEQRMAAKLSKNIKPEEISELQIKYDKVDVDAKVFDSTKITKGLNNELGRLKDEYELAVELDANPELGNMFADMFDIDLDTLPRTAKEYADRYTKSLNKYFKQMGADIELPNMLNLTRDDMMAFQQQVSDNKLQQVYFDMIQKGFDATHDALKKEISDEIKEYDKLLQKYAEYQYSLTRIAKEANEERKALVVRYGTDEQKEQARKIASKIEFSEDPSEIAELEKQLKSIVDKVAEGNNVVLQIGVAIDRKQAQESAKKAFEEFQKSPEWIVATGDLSGMTNKAIGNLIDSIEKYKKTAKNLDPKQIKQINNALKNLYNQQRQGNPFLLISNAIHKAKERQEEYRDEIQRTSDEISTLNAAEKVNGKLTDEQSERLEELKEHLAGLLSGAEDIGDITAGELVGGINAGIQAAKQAVGYFTDMMDALGGEKGSLASKRIKEIFGVLEKAGEGAAMGAMIGGGWGAAIGAVIGGLSAAATTWVDEWSGNASITRAMNASVKAAKDLENTYKRLTYVSEEFYGATSIASKEAAKNVKILELAELQRQLRLEESRGSKDRDQDKINEIRSQIIDLEHEVANATKQTVSDLLGISSHADFFEGLISDMISAFKNGEDAMEVFENKWAEMIDSMVTKMILGQVLQQWIKSLESGAESIVGKYTADYATQIADLESKLESVESMSRYDFMKYLEKNEPELYRQYFARYGINPDELDWVHNLELWMLFGEDFRNQYMEMLKNSVNSYTDEQARASLDATEELMDYYEEAGQEFKDKYLQAIVDKISDQYTFGQDSQQKLSALQQGIQGVSEDTAGAIEAMMNGMSQQIYLHTDLLIQIRDAVYNITGGDLEMGIQAQMLFQLQQSYTVQMAIQNILEGAVSPNGQSFRVELVS